MTTNAKTGVFLCQCGQKVAPFIDLNALADQVGSDVLPDHSVAADDGLVRQVLYFPLQVPPPEYPSDLAFDEHRRHQ